MRLGNPPRGAEALIAHTAAHGNGRALEAKAQAADDRAASWRTIFEDMIAKGLSLNAMARELVAKGDRTPRGSRWSDVAVSRMIARLELAPATA